MRIVATTLLDRRELSVQTFQQLFLRRLTHRDHFAPEHHLLPGQFMVEIHDHRVVLDLLDPRILDLALLVEHRQLASDLQQIAPDLPVDLK